MSGFDSPYIPGWDCHGLPIELKVEGLVGKPGDKVDAATFRKECRKYAYKQIEGQKTDILSAVQSLCTGALIVSLPWLKLKSNTTM